jgi:hypothetical protein
MEGTGGSGAGGRDHDPDPCARPGDMKRR